MSLSICPQWYLAGRRDCQWVSRNVPPPGVAESCTAATVKWSEIWSGYQVKLWSAKLGGNVGDKGTGMDERRILVLSEKVKLKKHWFSLSMCQLKKWQKTEFSIFLWEPMGQFCFAKQSLNKERTTSLQLTDLSSSSSCGHWLSVLRGWLRSCWPWGPKPRPSRTGSTDDSSWAPEADQIRTWKQDWLWMAFKNP